jgi:flagellar hook protein FlgE
MDVIANNVANVNTIGFKTARATFRDAFYQNMSGATSATPETGRTGVNPQQIGLGLAMGSIDSIMTQGTSQRTDFGMDIMIQNDGFFIVNDSSGTFFTRAGNITQDARGNLGINGMQLMGWDVELNRNTGRYEVNRSILTPLSMSGDKANMASEPTTVVELAGNLNIRDLVNRQVDDSVTPPLLLRGDISRSMSIFDSLGHQYVVDVRFTYHSVDGAPNYWTFEFVPPPGQPPGTVAAWRDGVRSSPTNPVAPAIMQIHAGNLMDAVSIEHGVGVVNPELMRPSGTLVFDSTGQLIGMGPQRVDADGNLVREGTPPLLDRPAPANPIPDPPAAGTLQPAWQRTMDSLVMYIVPISGFNPRATFGDVDGNRIVYGGDPVAPAPPPPPNNMVIDTDALTRTPVGVLRFDMSQLFNYGGMNTNAGFEPIDGNPPGTLRDISFGRDGTITGMFTNGRLRILGQVPVAMFSNPAGLQRLGSNMWGITANSGSFDGIGEIGDIQSGALEMSNVDLAQEFTDMIVTQRGFQASSRLISVSDEMIQELVNLRR